MQQRIVIKNATPQKVGINNAVVQKIGVGNAQTIIIGSDPYEGEYTVTPSGQTQTLQTAHKSMAQNVVINPIPNNYGLITYNGFELTVS